MEAVGTWNVPTPLEEVHQDLETKERKKESFYYHQANAAVNALGARVTEGVSPRNPCMCSSGAGADRRPVARGAFRSRGVPASPPLADADDAPSQAARFSAAVAAAAAALCSV